MNFSHKCTILGFRDTRTLLFKILACRLNDAATNRKLTHFLLFYTQLHFLISLKNLFVIVAAWKLRKSGKVVLVVNVNKFCFTYYGCVLILENLKL